jgi:hypothetical protein
MALQCKKDRLTGCYKAGLEIKGICLNYTIKVLQGDMDTSLMQNNWTDPNTGVAYQNVFALGSPCTFPPDINEGDEFYFKIGSVSPQSCLICQAFYTYASKRLSITVSKLPCN